MKREDIEKILKESDSILGNLTDGQHKVHENLKKWSSEAGKLGGKKVAESGQLLSVCGKGGKIGGLITFNNRTGLFGMSEEQKEISRVNGGKIQGNKNIETGQVIKAGKISAKSPKHPNNVKIKCQYCGKETNVGLNKRWHGEKCKHKQS